ncbi:MAG: hypothetical protein RR490_01645, partial [Niameybacter sp.]
GKTQRGEGGFGSTNKKLYKVVHRASGLPILDRITELPAINLTLVEACEIRNSYPTVYDSNKLNIYQILEM